ncbi:MAG: tRNA 2-thiouridine(34) synthase MnmA [Eubacterium sp.]|nr:tRNA 2-thiouridine(34) synthase MnmA [Eubacterium sp.]
MSNQKALIAMSGGVDSSVAAFLMKERGYECIGATMKLHDNTKEDMENEKTCCSLSDVEDARAVSYKLHMPYYVFNYKDQFEKAVISKFISSYESGATPNPCIDCNRFLKFNLLLNRAKELYCDYVITGHYARVEFNGERYILKKGMDETKDQSYVLYFLSQSQLSRIQFPLGEYRKSEIRRIAEENGFVNAAKKDSQDICFVPDGDYAKFIENYTGKRYEAGDFVSTNGEVLGKHKGIIRYTIGQRKGLGISSDKPLYVCSKNVEENTVTLGSSESLFTSEIIADDINLISVASIESPIHVKAKTRYNMKEQPCTVTQLDENHLKIVFDEPQRAITKGQAVVLYDGDIIVGGGTIK